MFIPALRYSKGEIRKIPQHALRKRFEELAVSGRGNEIGWRRKCQRMISMEVILYPELIHFRGNNKKGRMVEMQVASSGKNFQRYISQRMTVAFFFETAVQHQVGDVLNHLLVFDVKHANLSEKETHVQEYYSCKERE